MALPASLIAGFLWHAVDPTFTFVYGGAIALVTVALFIALKDTIK